MGYAATSIEAIARRAEVGKQTIYRWWPSKGLLLLDAPADACRRDTFPDTGDIVADMASQIHAVGRLFSHPDLAAERGELPPNPDPTHLIELLYYRLLVTHEPWTHLHRSPPGRRVHPW